jgi:hypothetical protein
MAGKRRRLTPEEETLLAAAEKLRDEVYTATLDYPILLLEVARKLVAAGRNPVEILAAVFGGPDAVARESMVDWPFKGIAMGRSKLTLRWRTERRGRPREPWEEDLAEYEALRRGGKSAADAAHEVHEAAKRQGRADVSWSDRGHIRNCHDRRRRARLRSAAK